jgi:hypothetical protein
MYGWMDGEVMMGALGNLRWNLGNSLSCVIRGWMDGWMDEWMDGEVMMGSLSLSLLMHDSS